MSEIAVLRPRETVTAPTRTLLRAGAEPAMVEEFRALSEATAPDGAPRYSEQAVLAPLARVLVRGSAGTNKDSALYELCHLVAAVDACGTATDRRNAFFLGPEAATPAQFKARIARALTRGGWRRPGFTQTRSGIAIAAADVTFMVHYTRMPFLAALYEFLAGMDSFAFYPELQAICDAMSAGALGTQTLKAASNRIASHLRQYRRRHVAASQQDGKFDLILAFLMARSPAGHLVIDDDSLLDFWCTKSQSGDFRAYRTVFDGFVAFIRALEESRRAEAVAAALPIGISRENGEVEPDDSAAYSDTGEWVSPLAILDQDPATAIKFFKKEGERKPIEALMHYGPLAQRLPIALLRLETFAPIQSAITTDLQIRRAHAVAARIACADAVPYREAVAALARILELIRRLQKAAFYALHREGTESVRIDAGDFAEDIDREALDRLLTDSAKTFRGIGRKGFDEDGLADPQRIEGFRLGAAALVAAADQIVRYLAAVDQRTAGDSSLSARFTADCAIFSKQFGLLYGALQ